MALPSKNRRTIVVDGTRYHWVYDGFRLQGKDSYIAIQNADGNGRKLYLRWIGLALPRFVCEAIQFAVQNGWRSDGKTDMEIGCDSFANPTEFLLKPDSASNYWYHDWWVEQNPGHIFLTPITHLDIEHWKQKPEYDE